MPNEIQKRLRYLREKAGLSQKEVAEYLNMKSNTYANQETKAKQVLDSIIEKLAPYYNVSTNFIRYGIKEEKKIEVKEPKGSDALSSVRTKKDEQFIDIFKCLPPKIQAKYRFAIEQEFKNLKNKNKE